ncbi:ribonuclease P protein component [Buchnera aphidicola (Neophyllaphis varicolor)]|uniref:ribonuclease P protein component n=1 Tax=Buchnera aphidicola TaxID=9 RepID=UPI0031B7EC7A
MNKNYFFSKKLRLLNYVDINKVYKNHSFFRIKAFQMIILSRLSYLEYPRLCINISKKYIKLSCDRNRIKRLVRESFRKLQYDLIKMDYIILFTSNISNISNIILNRNLGNLWNYYVFPNY